MDDTVFKQANSWGFACGCNAQGLCQILPQQTTQRWKLQLAGERWLLVVSDVPQILCDSSEALVFLERRCPKAKDLTSPEAR